MSKILVVGCFNPDRQNRYEIQLSYCLQKDFGFDVLTFDYREAMAKIGEYNTSFQIVKAIREHNPVMVMIFAGRGLNQDTINKVREYSNVKIFCWFHDHTEEPVGWFQKICSICDRSFITTGEKQVRDMYKDRHGNPAKRLISTPHPHFFYPIDCEKEYDVVFLGTPHSNRNSLLLYLLNEGIELSIFGHESAGFEWKTELKPYVKAGAYFEEANSIFNKAKIILNASGVTDTSLVYSDRYYHPIATKTFSVNQYTKDIDKDFVPDKEMIFWTTYGECAEKLKYYLENERERKAIEESMYKAYTERYAMPIVIKEMLKYV